MIEDVQGIDARKAAHHLLDFSADGRLMVYSAYEDLLTEYLARDFQMDPKFDRLPRLVAAMLWSAIEVALKRCAGLDVGKDQLNDDSAVLAECVGVVDDIETIFAGYIKRADNQIA